MINTKRSNIPASFFLGIIILTVMLLIGGCSKTALFTISDSIESINNPFLLESGDLDNDGDNDLVVTARDNLSVSDSIFVLINKGNGAFKAPVHYNLEKEVEVQDLEISDINGDGDFELITVNNDLVEDTLDKEFYLTVHTRNHSFIDVFSNWSRSGAFLSEDRYYIYGDKALYYGQWWPAFGSSYPTSLAMGDLDSDGDAELAVIASISIRILKNDGGGNYIFKRFKNTIEYSEYTIGNKVGIPDYINIDDLDRDGDNDISLVDKAQGALYVLKNNGDDTFSDFLLAEDWKLSDNEHVNDTVTGDLDGDSDIDIVVSFDHYVSVLKNGGNGLFKSPIKIKDIRSTDFGKKNLGLSYGKMALGDIDSDGDLDLAITNSDGFGLYILQNDGNSIFTSPEDYFEVKAKDVGFADFDGDGDLDLATAAFASDNYDAVRIYKNKN